MAIETASTPKNMTIRFKTGILTLMFSFQWFVMRKFPGETFGRLPLENRQAPFSTPPSIQPAYLTPNGKKFPGLVKQKLSPPLRNGPYAGHPIGGGTVLRPVVELTLKPEVPRKTFRGILFGSPVDSPPKPWI